MHEPAKNYLLHIGTQQGADLFEKVKDELSFSVNICMIFQCLHNNSLE
jgi:hypothetical protein